MGRKGSNKRNTKAMKLYLKHHNQCEQCGSIERLEVHHKIAVSLGGFNGWGNLQTLCYWCHKEITKKEHKNNSFDWVGNLEKQLKKRGYSEDLAYRIMMRFVTPASACK